MALQFEVLRTVVVDGMTDGGEIPIPDEAERGDFLIVCFTSFPPAATSPSAPGLQGRSVPGAFYLFGFPILTPNPDYDPHVPDSKWTPITGVIQSEFAGLDAGHVVVLYRGIKAIGFADLRSEGGPEAGGDDVKPGGPDYPFPILPVLGNWHGMFALGIGHTLSIPGPLDIVDPPPGIWAKDATVFTPFFAASVFRYMAFELPHLGPMVPYTPDVYAAGLASNFRSTVSFGFILRQSIEATRQFPRDDAAGVIGGTRIFPPPRSRRVAGGRHL